MLTLLQYINENIENIFEAIVPWKHNHAGDDYFYPKAVIKEIINNKQIKLENGDIIDLSKITNEDIVELNKILNDIEQYSSKNFNSILNKYGITYNKISKSPFSGVSKSTKGTAAEPEIGVLVKLCQLLKISEDNIKCPKNLLDKTHIFLDEHSDWNKSCEESAKTIINNVGVDLSKNYYFHRGSELFNSIKTFGESQLKEMGISVKSDKWNPSDIFLIKTDIQTLSDIENRIIKTEDTTVNFVKNNDITNVSKLQLFNEYLGEFTDIIGISLKKGESNALHGSYALSHFEQDLKDSISYDKTTNENILSMLNTIKNIDKINNKIQITQIEKNDAINIKQHIDNLFKKQLSNNFIKWFYGQLSFIGSHKSFDSLELDIKTAYLAASSQLKQSAPFYKVLGNDFHVYSNKNINIDVQLNNIFIPLNGNMDILFNIIISNNENKTSNIYRLQLRSRGSKPQFTIVNGHTKPKTTISIKDIK